MIVVFKRIVRNALRFIKKVPVLFKCNKTYLDCRRQLKKCGFRHIRRFSLLTWKYYGVKFIRITVSCFYNSKKFVLKINKGDSGKVKNSILFQRKFNDIFDFIPKSIAVNLNGYDCLAIEHINAVSFDRLSKTTIMNNLNYFLAQAIHILDALNDFKIVHCDLEAVNLLVEKRTKKIFVIDFDTAYGDIFNGGALPPNTIKRRIGGGAIYDDAYSFVQLFKRCDIQGIEENPQFVKLQNLINRNCLYRSGNR